MARRYARDNRGRFSSTGATARGGRLRTASGGKRETQTRQINARPAGTIAKNRSAQPAALSRRPIANGIRRTGTTPLKLRANNVRPYRPATFDGKFAQIDRQINKTMKPLVDDIRNISRRSKSVKGELRKIERELERSNARDIANRNKKGITGEVARSVLQITGTKEGKRAISRRMQRALTAASRGSSAGKRAVQIHLNHMAGMGPGKPSKGKNNLQPGPRNTKGPPKRQRRKP